MLEYHIILHRSRIPQYTTSGLEYLSIPSQKIEGKRKLSNLGLKMPQYQKPDGQARGGLALQTNEDADLDELVGCDADNIRNKLQGER